MSRIEARLAERGLVLPPPVQAPPGVSLPFRFVRIVGTRVFVAGHGPQSADGSIAQPLGKVGRDLSVEQGYAAARLVALSLLGSLQRALGDLDRVTAWCRIFGMVELGPGLSSTAERHQRLLGPDPRALWRGGRRARTQRGRHGRAAVRHPGGDRGRGRDRALRTRAALARAADRRRPAQGGRRASILCNAQSIRCATPTPRRTTRCS